MSRRPDRSRRIHRPPSAGAAWSPSDISGLALWLDNSLITVLGGVSAWPDISGAGHHFTQANPAIQPSFVASETDFPTAQAAVKFDVAQSHLACPAFAVRWVAVVGVYPGATWSAGNPALFQGAVTTTERVFRASGAGTNVWITTNAWCDTASFYLDGVNTTQALTTANAPHLWLAELSALSTPATQWSLGGVLTAATWPDSVCMVLAGNTPLSGADRAQLAPYAQGRGMIP